MTTALNIAAFQKSERPAPKPEPDKVEWSTMDVNTLDDNLQEAYFAYRKQ